MAANLDRPKIIIPSECPNGAYVIGTGSDILVHTCTSGKDEIDAVTVEGAATAGQILIVKCTATTGALVSIPCQVTGNEPPVPVIDRALMCGGAQVYVNGTATAVFKVSVERYPVGTNDPQTP